MIPKTHKAVVLVHGLWMHRWSLYPIAKYLKDRGYNTYRFGYKTTTQPFDFNMQKLQAFVNSLEEETVHLVVHSYYLLCHCDPGAPAMALTPKLKFWIMPHCMPPANKDALLSSSSVMTTHIHACNLLTSLKTSTVA